MRRSTAYPSGSKHGAPLMDPEGYAVLRRELLPLCFLVTPNLYETRALTGKEVGDLNGMRAAASEIADLGPRAVLIKGGHLTGEARDLLLYESVFYEYPSERIDTAHTHGTGCTYSAAITACLARGLALPEAVGVAKRFIAEAIRTNPGFGGGNGPVNHFAATGL